MERDAEQNQMIPFLSIASREFEKDLNVLKLIMNQLEKRSHSEKAYRFSERAQMAAGWWFYGVYVTLDFCKGFLRSSCQGRNLRLEIRNLPQLR